MQKKIVVRLEPLGVELYLAEGSRLDDYLSAWGVEFPCGGAGRCRGCRIRILEGEAPPDPRSLSVLSPEEISAGWRLACRTTVNSPLTIEIAQWQTPVLVDDSQLPFEPASGFAIAVDLGTTTIAAQLLDLQTGRVAGVRTAVNPQCRFGADIMSRVEYALANSGAGELRKMVRATVGKMCSELAGSAAVSRVWIAGNAVMHHLFCGLPVEPFAAAPFESPYMSEQSFSPRDLDWELPNSCEVRFLPCLGGFVGSDILAGIIACGIHRRTRPSVLVDLGTNGEMAAGSGHGILCASAAAGPAFEGARIRMGMRAAEGAIVHAELEWTPGGPRLRCQVQGGAAPRGICGSGLVDATACALEAGWFLPDGRIPLPERKIHVCGAVWLWQKDVRELQLAKAAVAAGLEILLRQLGIHATDLERVDIAGAFGNYVRLASAQRIGLLALSGGGLFPAGNTSLRGLKMVLLAGSHGWEEVLRVTHLTRHLPLGSDSGFQDEFVRRMPFPESAPAGRAQD